MLFFSIGISVLLLLFTLLNQVTFDETAGWLIILCIAPVFAFTMVTALVYALIRWREMGKRAGLPLLIQVACLFIAYGVATLSQSIDLNFRVHAGGFKEVIALVEAGQLQPDQYDGAKLPSQYKYLSADGTIRFQKENGVTTVLFFDSVGILGEFHGYVYRSNNSPSKDFVWCDDWFPLNQPQENWFVCVSY